MKRFLLDTGVLVHYARKSTLYKQIEAEQGLSQPDTLSMISVVTIAEIISFGIQHNWGQQKIQDVENLFKKIITIDINTGDNALIRAYANFDAYSKNKLSGSPLGSSITMGKK